MKKRVTKEAINESFERTEKEYSKIFNKLMEVKSLGEDDAKTLSKSLGFLSIAYYNLVEGLEINLNKRYKGDKWLLILSVFTFYLTYLLFLLTASHIAFLGIFLSAILGVIKAVDLREVKALITTFNRNKNNKDLMILIDNCNRLLEGRVEAFEKENKSLNKEDRDSFCNVERANAYIQIYLANDFLPDIDVETKEMMRKILQESLNTEEKDLYVLLEMAREEVLLERLSEQSELTRVLDKNDKK